MLIQIEGHDIDIFEAIADIERYLEPWYVEAEEFTIIDDQSILYNASVVDGGSVSPRVVRQHASKCRKP